MILINQMSVSESDIVKKSVSMSIDDILSSAVKGKGEDISDKDGLSEDLDTSEPER